MHTGTPFSGCVSPWSHQLFQLFQLLLCECHSSQEEQLGTPGTVRTLQSLLSTQGLALVVVTRRSLNISTQIILEVVISSDAGLKSLKEAIGINYTERSPCFSSEGTGVLVLLSHFFRSVTCGLASFSHINLVICCILENHIEVCIFQCGPFNQLPNASHLKDVHGEQKFTQETEGKTHFHIQI